MNDLFSRSFSRFHSDRSPSRGASDRGYDVEMGAPPAPAPSSGGANLDKFFEDVECIKEELKELESLHQRLRSSHEQSKTLHNARAVKDLRSRMEGDAKVVKVRLEALDRSNAANRSLPGCGPGSSSDRTRTSVVSGLRKKLQDSMESFNALRQLISSEYRETVQRRYFTVTGENPDERTLDLLISTGRFTICYDTWYANFVKGSRFRVCVCIERIRADREKKKKSQTQWRFENYENLGTNFPFPKSSFGMGLVV
ncbi:hypothetical protein EUGRSUZ_K01922 [Eucalyptus grandis]|uniref:Uncharacterized protein n=2 Tax=Eucalyptus grandis TaxID=71139 RepID=A0ACC3IUS6_EUCGR|nr:hypothetical protein EUGRSUZ_K01922 [Eucalyptus grandis]